MTDAKKKIEALRKDLFLATANRGLAYTAILRELRKELGDERASEIFKRAIYNHGANVARLFNPPNTLAEFKDWLLDFFPDEGAMNEPEVIRCDEHELAVRLPRCPLKEGWRMFGLSDEEVADMCRHADAFDHGFFGSFFDYEMESWANRPDDGCVLHFRPKGHSRL
jgi:predicted ArsR family transcriptional regulator